MPSRVNKGGTDHTLSTSANMADNPDNNVKPFDGTKLNEPMWYLDGQGKLYDKVPGAREFITKGTVNSRHSKIIVRSVRHAQDLVDGSYVKGTLQKPYLAKNIYEGPSALAPKPARDRDARSAGRRAGYSVNPGSAHADGVRASYGRRAGRHRRGFQRSVARSRWSTTRVGLSWCRPPWCSPSLARTPWTESPVRTWAPER